MLITISYDIVTAESAEYGDYAETGWVNEDGVSFDDVDDAIAWLRREGATQASSYPQWCAGTWYSTEGTKDYRTGDEKHQHYHLAGFSDEDARKVYSAIIRR